MRFAFVAALAAPLLFAAASAGEAAFPDYEVTPLTKADLDLYLGIMHAAADHNAHLTADDKAAVDLTIQIQKHPPPPITGMPTPAQMQVLTHNSNLLARGVDLAVYDNKIAQQRGVPKRYEAIQNEVDQVIAMARGAVGSCGSDDCGPPPTAAQIARGKKIEAALRSDKPLVAPHVAEIAALKKQIGGFMFGGQ
jgi:hypothetical protein